MKFSHPLARSAKVYPAALLDGASPKILTVVTTLELDPEHKKYKSEQVERLREAVRAHLADHAGKADGYVLMNKPKD